MRAEACTCWSVAWVVGCAKCDQAVWHRGAYLVGMHLWPMPWPIESKTSKHEFNPFRGELCGSRKHGHVVVKVDDAATARLP